MIIHETAYYTIYFGDVEQSIEISHIREKRNHIPALQVIGQTLDVEQMAFLQQQHSTKGINIDQCDYADYYFDPDGDYIITQKKNCGVGVTTADCLPIIVFEPGTHTIAIIHAGWKGLSKGIVEKVIAEIEQKANVPAKNLQVYLGPSARGCCYEVQQDCIDKFLPYQEYFSEFFTERNEKTYFDFRDFFMVIAKKVGLQKEKIYTRYNVCTICNLLYCSYRRDKHNARRQVTMITLR